MNPTLSARCAKGPRKGAFAYLAERVEFDENPVRQNGRIAVLHGAAAPKG
jgi:hypothetical protein